MTDHPAISLREYVDTRLNGICQANDAAHHAMERAVTKAEEQLRERLAGMNEFREQLKDQAGMLATRESVELTRNALEGDIERLEGEITKLKEAMATSSGRYTQTQWMVGVFFLVISVFLHFLAP